MKAKFQPADARNKDVGSAMSKALRQWARDKSFTSPTRNNPTGKAAGKTRRTATQGRRKNAR